MPPSGSAPVPIVYCVLYTSTRLCHMLAALHTSLNPLSYVTHSIAHFTTCTRLSHSALHTSLLTLGYVCIVLFATSTMLCHTLTALHTSFHPLVSHSALQTSLHVLGCVTLTVLHTSLHPLGCHIQHCTLHYLHFITSTRLCHIYSHAHCTHCYIHYIKSWAHSNTYCATSIVALSRATALHSTAHMPSHASYLQHRTYSIAPAMVPIGCIMGTQHCTPQRDHPQFTPHTLSITYGTASIRLCYRPTALLTALHITTFLMPHTHCIAHCSISTRPGHKSTAWQTTAYPLGYASYP